MDITAAATSAVTTAVANTQAQTSLIAIRLAAESQRQMVALLAQSVAAASNPDHLGQQVDTFA
jgi:hypothetical protein